MKKVLIAFALGALSIHAATLVPTGFPAADAGFTATFNTSGPTLTLATPLGPDTLNVFDDSNAFLGNVIATDNGTPGLLILTVNGGLTEEVALSFNTGLASIDGAGNFVIGATGTPATTITDPALARLIGDSTFIFAPTGSTENPFVFDFSAAVLPAATVPEPAVAFTVGIGLFALSALRLRKSSR